VGFASGPTGKDPSVIEWRCSQHFQNSELHPVADFMERFLAFGRDESTTARFDRLVRHLENYELGQPEFVALFAKLLFLPPGERYAGAGLTLAREREETFRALRQWLRSYSAKRTVLFIVEDLHWSDASSQEFLGQFIAEGPNERILTVLTFRPEFKMPWAPVAHQTILALNRLTRRQVAECMRRDPNGALPESLVAQIYQRTSGVPLLVEEFSRMVRESGVFEIFRDKREVWNLADCIAYLAVLNEREGSIMDELLNHVRHLRGSPCLDDDFSIIEARFH
jgi:predicted ATPase